ncbi:hypothetical protein H1C71_021994 [Ictidomys tridecemlineatus]|nr:hypothetical protein H1C71_021994 [Ictidomys tridecemlineatus]
MQPTHLGSPLCGPYTFFTPSHPVPGPAGRPAEEYKKGSVHVQPWPSRALQVVPTSASETAPRRRPKPPYPPYLCASSWPDSCSYTQCLCRSHSERHPLTQETAELKSEAALRFGQCKGSGELMAPLGLSFLIKKMRG